MECNKLHIGPGKAYLPGWVNVDIFSNVKADLYASALAIPYPQESFDLIYSGHVLEHINRNVTLSALTHWRSLLKPGGILRLAVPNFQAIVDHYNKHGQLKILLGLLYGGQKFMLDSHCVVFDPDYLRECLSTVGFKTIRMWDWRDTEHAEYDDFAQAYLPHLQKDTGLLVSLNMEAIK